MANGTAIVTGVVAAGIVNSPQMALTYIQDGDEITLSGGKPLALVGDFVGTGTIQPISDPVQAQLTYKGIPMALTTALTTAHVGLTHPTPPPIPSTLNKGSPDCIVKNIYRLVRIGDPTTCLETVVMNPALTSMPERYKDLRDPGNPPV